MTCVTVVGEGAESAIVFVDLLITTQKSTMVAMLAALDLSSGQGDTLVVAC